MKFTRMLIGSAVLGLTLSLAAVGWAQSKAGPGPSGSATVHPPVEAEQGPSPKGAEAARARIVGKLPGKDPEISLESRETALSQVLQTVAQKAGWNLILDVPEVVARRKITLRLAGVPASEVFYTVLELGDLQAEFKDRVVVVKPAIPEPGVAEVKIDGAFQVHSRDRNGKHSEDRVVFGQSLRIEKDDSVNDAVAIGGSLVVAGHVRGSAVAIGGSVTLEPGAVVDDEAVSVGGTIDVQPGATLSGDRVSISGSIGGAVSKVVSIFADLGQKDHDWEPPWFVAKWGSNLTLLVLALLVVLLMPARVARIEGILRARPGASALVGLALLFGFIPVCLLFLFTIIGIPLIPLLVLAFVGLHLLGMSAFLVLLGERLPFLRKRKSPWLALLLGFVVFAVINAIPFLGAIVAGFVSFVSAGAALLSRLGSDRTPVKQTS